jgi:hypothetical protein
VIGLIDEFEDREEDFSRGSATGRGTGADSVKAPMDLFHHRGPQPEDTLPCPTTIFKGVSSERLLQASKVLYI